MSPELTLPLKFRSTGIEACDHSECFMFGYDLHRLYNTTERPPRILMNPTVEVAYASNWYTWQTSVLRIPSVRLWIGESNSKRRMVHCADMCHRTLEPRCAIANDRLDLGTGRAATRLLHLGSACVQRAGAVPSAARSNQASMGPVEERGRESEVRRRHEGACFYAPRPTFNDREEQTGIVHVEMFRL